MTIKSADGLIHAACDAAASRDLPKLMELRSIVSDVADSPAERDMLVRVVTTFEGLVNLTLCLTRKGDVR